MHSRTLTMGRYETISRSLNFPNRISTKPREAVPSGRITSVVERTSSTVPPLSRISFAILFAMEDRKISPASCTVPMAKSKDENMANAN